MLILGRLVKVTEGAFERKLRDNREKSGFGLFLENPRDPLSIVNWIILFIENDIIYKWIREWYSLIFIATR